MSRATVSRMSRISPSRTWTKFSTTFFQPRPSSPPTGHRQPPRSTRNGFLRAFFLPISGMFLFFRICSKFSLNFFKSSLKFFEFDLKFFLLISGKLLFFRICLGRLTVDINEHHFQASYQRRSQREHFSVDSGWFSTTVWLSTRQYTLDVSEWVTTTLEIEERKQKGNSRFF